MIDPVIFTIGSFAVRWYGVIVVIAITVGAFIVDRELKRRGEKSDIIWDVLIWVVFAGIIGARLWYVLNATIGGNSYYIDNPLQIINIPQGGLHIFGAFLFGAAALLIYLRRNKLDPWLFLDAIGPAALIGQGIGRIANFINQELYGPPTKLPWGLKIEATHRLADYPASQYPVDVIRFHPTFAYEMLWNFVTAGILLWLSRRYEKELKPGAIFAGWLLAAGVGRTWIELFFRPDQPQIPGVGITYSAIFASLMAIAGAVLLMARYRAITPKFAENWEEEYQLSTQPKIVEAVEEVEETEETDETEEPVMPKKKTPRTKKAPAAKTSTGTAKKASAKKTSPRRTTTTPRGTRRTARTKKSS